MLNEESMASFKRDGFVVIPNVLNKEDIDQARKYYKKTLDYCKKHQYENVRMFASRSFDKILGIEQLFSPEIFDLTLIDLLKKSNVLKSSTELLQSEQVFLALHRLICTHDISFSGAWHRDGEANTFNHVQSALLFYPEAGLKIIPGSHNMTDEEIGFDYLKEGPSAKFIQGEYSVSGNAGDLILFHSSILHRGTCVGWGRYHRAHLHLRIAKVGTDVMCQNLRGKEHLYDSKCLDKSWEEFLSNSVAKRSKVANISNNIAPDYIRRKFSEVRYHLSKFIPIEKFTKKYIDCIHLLPEKKFEHLYEK